MKTIIALGLVLVSAASAFGQNKIIPLMDVPKEARDAADRAAPEVLWSFALKDKDGWYLIMGKDTKKQTVEFLTEKGKDGVVRAEIPLDHVPAVVKEALRKGMPNFVAKSVQACGLTTNKITVYRFQGEGYSGGNAGVYVSASGKKVTAFKD